MLPANPPQQQASSVVLPVVAGVSLLGVIGVAGYFGYQAYNKMKANQQMQSAQTGCTTCGQQVVGGQKSQQVAASQTQTSSQTKQIPASQQPSQTPTAQVSTGPILPPAPQVIKSPFPEGPFKIVSDIDNKLAVDIADESKSANAHLILWPFHGKENQRFVFDDANDTIANVGSSLLLSAGTGAGIPKQGDKIIQGPSANGARQQWEYDSDNKELKIVGTDLCLDAEGSAKSGTKMVAWKCHGGDNQRFDLIGM